MSRQSVLADLATFKADLEALKSESMIKYRRVKDKTAVKVAAIENYRQNYPDGSDEDIYYNDLVFQCNAILERFELLSSGYQDYWS